MQAIVWLNKEVPFNGDVKATIVAADVARVDENNKQITLTLQGGATLVVGYSAIIQHDTVDNYTWLADQLPGYFDIRLAPAVVAE